MTSHFAVLYEQRGQKIDTNSDVIKEQSPNRKS